MMHSLKSRQDSLEVEMSKLKDIVKKSAEDTEFEIKQVKASLLDIDIMLRNYKDKPTMQEITSLLDDRIKACKGELIEETAKEIPPAWSAIVSKTVETKLESKFEQVSTDVAKVNVAVAEAKKISDEDKDRESRASNIILYRVPETDKQEERIKYDKDFFCQMANEALEVDMKSEDIKAIFRLGKKGDNCRPLLVQLRERSVKNRIMESLFKLKSSSEKFKNISVTHDLTKQERLICKTLVDEAKKKQSEEKGEFIWRVRGLPGQMKVIRIQKK